MAAGHFEAKKHAYRQTQDGVVISFVMHPNDVSPDIATAPLGTRYMVGFAEIGDDGKPVVQLAERKTSTLVVAGSNPAGPVTERTPFKSLPLAQQAALRCRDAEFRRFLADRYSKGAFETIDVEAAAAFVRHHCSVKTRADLDKTDFSRNAWLTLEGDFQAWNTDRMYGDMRR